MKLILALLLILTLSYCNIWDNIMSEMEATTPIVPSNSFNFNFDVPQYNSKGNIDFNAKLQIFTIIIYKDALIMNI